MIYVSKKTNLRRGAGNPLTRRIESGVFRRLVYVVARLTGGILVKRPYLRRLARREPISAQISASESQVIAKYMVTVR